MRGIRLGALVAGTLAVAACGRTTEVADVDHGAACSASAAITELKPMILEGAGLGGRARAKRARGAEVALTDPRLIDYDEAGGVANCSATAHLDAPALGAAAAQASQSIVYTVRQGTDGAVEVTGVESAQDRGAKPFASLQQADRIAPMTHAPPPLAPAPVAPVETSLTEPDQGPPRRAAPVLSDDAQQLVDQAGDSRTLGNSETDSFPPNAQPDTASPTTLKEQGR